MTCKQCGSSGSDDVYWWWDTPQALLYALLFGNHGRARRVRQKLLEYVLVRHVVHVQLNLFTTRCVISMFR